MQRARTNNVIWGATITALGVLIMPGMDAVAKSFAGVLPAPVVTWGRFLAQILLIAPIALAVDGRRAVAPPHWSWHIWRGLTVAGASVCFFAGLMLMPQAETTAIGMTHPFIVAALAPLLLKERSSPKIWLAALTGFSGVLLIVRPGSALFGPEALLPFASACFFGLYLLSNRHLAGTVSTYSLQLTAAVVVTLAVGILILLGDAVGIPGFVLTAPTLNDWLFLTLMAVIGTTGHVLITKGAEYAPAAVIAPLHYLGLISATLLGYLIFNELPRGTSWIGLAVIAASGVYITRVRAEPARPIR